MTSTGRKRAAVDVLKPSFQQKNKPKKGSFIVAMRGNKNESVPVEISGYVLGVFGASKSRGDYFWSFTHIPTGLKLATYPVHERKESALNHLVELHKNGLSEVENILLSTQGWGDARI